MTDQQIIEAVLKSCGWRKSNSPLFWVKNDEFYDASWMERILTSLDACHEVFEKDAPDEYWGCLIETYTPHERNHTGWGLLTGKATPRQRCLAWLNFKQLEDKTK